LLKEHIQVQHKKQKRERISPQLYRELLKSVQLEKMYLDALSSKVNRELEGEKSVSGGFSDDQSFQKTEEGFIVTHTGDLTLKVKRKIFIKIQTTYTLEYHTDEDLPDNFFDIFLTTAVPVQVWPFVRQTYFDITSRMGLSPLTLPLRKVPNF